jgi:hypothetical protein
MNGATWKILLSETVADNGLALTLTLVPSLLTPL